MVRLAFTEAQLQARKRGLARFRLLEILGVFLVLAVAAALMVTLSQEQSARTKDLTQSLYAMLVIMSLQSAVMTRIGFGLLAEPRSRLQRAAPVRGAWLITAVTPVAVLCLLLPWILGGTFDDHRESSPATIAWLLFLLLAAATISGPLLLVVVLLPIELLIRGLARLATGRTKSARSEAFGQMRLAGFITYLALMCLLIGGTATFATPTRRGHVIAVMLGFAGNEGVEHPWLLWIGRLMFYAFLATILWVFYSEHRRKRANQREEREQ